MGFNDMYKYKVGRKKIKECELVCLSKRGNLKPCGKEEMPLGVAVTTIKAGQIVEYDPVSQQFSCRGEIDEQQNQTGQEK